MGIYFPQICDTSMILGQNHLSALDVVTFHKERKVKIGHLSEKAGFYIKCNRENEAAQAGVYPIGIKIPKKIKKGINIKIFS